MAFAAPLLAFQLYGYCLDGANVGGAQNLFGVALEVSFSALAHARHAVFCGIIQHLGALINASLRAGANHRVNIDGSYASHIGIEEAYDRAAEDIRLILEINLNNVSAGSPIINVCDRKP